jgi:hypothetical protein
VTAQQTDAYSHMLFCLNAFAFYGFLILSVERVVLPAVTPCGMQTHEFECGTRESP